MSGEMIAIVAVGVALAGVILTSLRGTEARLGAQIKDLRGEVGELRERMAHEISELREPSVSATGSVAGELPMSAMCWQRGLADQYGPPEV